MERAVWPAGGNIESPDRAVRAETAAKLAASRRDEAALHCEQSYRQAADAHRAAASAMMAAGDASRAAEHYRL